MNSLSTHHHSLPVLAACLFFLLMVSGSFNLKAQPLADLYEQVKNSVVVIQVIESGPALDGSGKTVTSGGLGSGFLISEEGLVLTAAHVVQTADRVMVEFLDGQRIPANVTGSDPEADVAILKLVWAPKDPVVARLGDSGELRIGEDIFIVGAPYGLNYSLSAGHVSSIRSEKPEAGELIERQFIQTDAAINHGNSGGPMFNMKGQVVGICSYILSESGGFQGLGFAATSNVAKSLLIDQPAIWSGMDGDFISGTLAGLLNVPQSGGILVKKVVLASPAGMLGLEGGKYKMQIEEEELIIGGDIILAINGITIDAPESVHKARQVVKNLGPGYTLSAKVLRAGQILDLEWKVE